MGENIRGIRIVQPLLIDVDVVGAWANGVQEKVDLG